MFEIFERRVGNLLNSSQSIGATLSSLPSISADLGQKQFAATIKSISSQQTDSSKEEVIH